jgi:hypothetical protein
MWNKNICCRVTEKLTWSACQATDNVRNKSKETVSMKRRLQKLDSVGNNIGGTLIR